MAKKQQQQQQQQQQRHQQDSTESAIREIRVAYIPEGNYDVVINAGSVDGVCVGDDFEIYVLSEKIIPDPISGKPLEKLKTVRGFGRVIQVQESIATLRSSKSARLARSARGGWTSALASLYPDRIYEDELRKDIPFDGPKMGDYAKRIVKR